MRRSTMVAAAVTLAAAAWSVGARAERPAVYDPTVQARMEQFQQRIDALRTARQSNGQPGTVTAPEVDALKTRLGDLKAQHGAQQAQLVGLQTQLDSAQQAAATRPLTRGEQLGAKLAGRRWLAQLVKSPRQRAEQQQIATLEQRVADTQTRIASGVKDIAAAKDALRDARVLLHGEPTLDAMATRLNGRYQQRVGAAVRAFNAKLPDIDKGLRYAEQWNSKYSSWASSMRRNPGGDWGMYGDIELAQDAKGTAQNVDYVCAKLSAATVDLGAFLSKLRLSGSNRDRVMADALEAQLRPGIESRFEKCRGYAWNVRGDLLLRAPPNVPAAQDIASMLGR